jgi:hypothetical protein
MKSPKWFFALLSSIILSTNNGCGRAGFDTGSPLPARMAPDALPPSSPQSPDGPAPSGLRQGTDVCIVETGLPLARADHVAEISGTFYVVGQVTDSFSSTRILAAAIRADCMLDAVLTSRVGTNPYNLTRIVTPTGDGNLLIRGGTQQFIPPPFQYFKMVVDPRMNPVHTEIDDSDFYVAGQAPYPDGTVVLVGIAGEAGLLSRFALKKENPDGTRILTFGGRGDGTITIGFGPSTRSYALAGTLQSDGEILFAAGELFADGGAISNAVASLTPDGRVISTNTFSAVERNLEMTVAAAPRAGAGFVGATVSIVLGGGETRSFLYCASDDLTVDTSCGTDGWTEIAVLPDSSHYVEGLARRDGGYVGLVNSCPFGGQCRAFAFCADENIVLDGSCAGGGLRMIDVGPGDNFGKALTARANGTYVAAIDNCTSSSACRPAIACFNADLSSIACR